MPLHYSSRHIIAFASHHAARPFFASADRLHSRHCRNLSLIVNAKASLRSSVPLPFRSTRLNALASHIHASPLLFCADQCLCDAKPINAFAGPSRAKPFFCYAKAGLGYALPLLVCSLPLLNYAVPSRISTPLLHSGSTPCHTTATPDLAMPSRLNAMLSRRDTLRSHASPVPSYALPRPCHAEQFPCVTLIRPAYAVHSHAIATHSHATTKQCLTLPSQFQADRIYAIAFLCFAILCRRISALNHSIQCRHRAQPVYATAIQCKALPPLSQQSLPRSYPRSPPLHRQDSS